MAIGRATTKHGGRHARKRQGRRFSRGWSVLGVLALGFAGAIIPATTASAAEWGISKTVTSGPGPYEPGQTVTYAIQISCSDPNADPCTNTVMTDELPPELILVDATVSSSGGATNGVVVADPATNTVTYTADSNPNGQTPTITVSARVDPDLPYSADGVPIPNTATVVADNAAEESSTVEITPVVELNLDSETTKAIDPEGALAAPGTAATMTITGTNTSNAPVDTLVIQDPVDPTATPNPFTYLEYTSTGDIEMPPNATEVTEEYWDGDSWEPLDDSVDPAAVQGVRYTFSGDIQPQATATVPVQVQQSDAVEELTDPTTVTNDTSSLVTLDDASSDPTTASDTYVITPPNNSVTASKSFDPAQVSAGDPTTVTLGAQNTGTAVTSLTITEPAPGTNNVFEGDDPITFTGWGTDGQGAGVVWPDGATGATVTFVCDGTAAEPISTTEVDTLPDPPAGCNVTGFTIEYTGNISNGAEATVPFTADTDPDQIADDVDHPNQIQAEVPSADPALADDTLTTLVDRLATDITKVITPSTFPAVPGQSVVVQLPSSLAGFGPDGSTTDADTFVVQEPEDPANPGEFWDNFEATGVRSTSVPPNATLTVEYWDPDTGTWSPAPDCPPVHGPATVNCDLPAGAEGVRFTFTADDGSGFPPGTEFQPNFTADYTGPADREDPITNCAYSSASGGSVEMTDPVEACDDVDPFPVDGDGTGADFMDKTFLGDPPTVQARTDDQVTAQLTWSTGGFSGVGPMVVQDEADPVAADDTAIAGSFYDAFNLVSIALDDPMLQYDQVQSVELFIDGAWVEASGDPCPEACDGTFPGYTLTADEQTSATSVRLTFVESPSRTDNPTDPTAPAAGDGVARSTQADGRHVDLTFQVRDTKRSDPDEAVLGTTNGTMYNTGDAGVVNDTARGTGTFEGNDYTDTDADEVTILDTPVNVTVTKDWTGGPLSVPPDGTPLEFYPTTNAVITGTNNSTAKVDELRLADPGAEDSDDVITAAGTKPFDAFTLTHIDLTPPAGTDTTTVILHYENGDTARGDEAGAEALTPADLVDVVGVEVLYDGLVAPAAKGVMNLTLQLRQLDRYTNAPVTVADYSPVPNGAVATIDDPGGFADDPRQAFDDATMELQDAAIGIDVTKTFSPDTIVEPNHGNPGDTPVIMTLTGQPLGPSRSVEMTLTDDDPQFWNQYDFVGFDPSAALAAPIQQVQVDAFVGGTFVGDPDSPDPVEVTGGQWVTGVAGPDFALPDGVEPSQVQGLRFTFSRTDNSIWENPATPTQSVPIQILRRDEMRSGGDVQHDLASNPTAPGETAPGVASNTVDGTTTGADLVVDPGTGDLVPVSADDSADAQMLYQHATNGVTIVKDFDGVPTGGSEAPEALFPMNITFTNTGDRPIVDPVVTDDPMPFDDDGAQLRIAAGEDEPFRYALGGVADPDPSTPDLPTDAAQVTVDQQGDIDSLGFTFPAGSVLEVGQSYTITVMVQFRLGLPPNTLVENTAGVTGDRPWDECSPRLNEETGACEADADVKPSASAALEQQKLVKATNDDELDVIVDPDASNPPDECTPNAAGFYAYPCTPVIAPGHDETWRVRVSNAGNLPMDTLVLYDRLPTPGDTGSYAGSQRGSAWAPILTDDPPPTFVGLPDGAVGTFYYSTTQDYCMGDIQDPLTMPCPTDDPETGWVRLTGDEPDSVFEQITALKAVVTFPEDDLFGPGDTVILEGTTTTPPVAPEAGDRSIAWNSAAAGGVVVTQSAGRVNNLPTEGVKVGVATATGPLEVNKLVSGAGAQYAPDSFAMNVQCTSAVGTWVEEELDPIPITVVPGTPTTVPNLPYGAECTITEDGTNGQTDLIVGSVTIGEDPEAVSITAMNVYDLGGLVLSKDVESDAVDQAGDPIAYGPFEATVECTFLGDPVFADGYDAENPMVVELAGDGTPVELTGLPVNSECTVTETNAANAAGTTITVTTPGEDPVETDGTSADVTVVPDEDGTSGAQVALENTFDVGAINLQKVVDGEGGPAYGAGPFTIQVVCTYDADGDGPGEPGTVYDGTVVLGGAGPLDAQIANLPVGAECTITETNDGGATGSVVVPDTVTVDADEPAEVVITNTFDVGTIEVDKELDGLGALYGPGPFEVTLACTYGEDANGDPVDIVIPGGAARTFVPGQPAVYEGLPVGAECTVTETDDFGATETSVSVDGGAPVDGNRAEVVVPPADGGEATTVTVTVTNTFLTAPVLVEKTVDGDGADFAPDMPEIPPLPELPDEPVTPEELAALIAQLEDFYAQFPLDGIPYRASLECTFQGAEIPIPGGAVRPFGPGLPGVYFGLPVGATCSVTETETGGATSVTVDPSPFVVDEDRVLPAPPQVVTVTNTYDVGSIQVEKVLDGDGAEFVTAPFEVSLACTFQGEEIEVPGGATRTVTPDDPATYDGLPIGAECVVTETDAAGAASSTVSTTVEGGDPGQVVVPGADADPAVITVTNTFDVGGFTVEKVVTGDGAAFGTGPFEVTAECTFQGEPIDVPDGATRTVTPDGPATYDGLPVGAECVVTESDDGGATSATVSTAVEDGDPGQVVVPGADADPAVVTVTNTFDVGSVAVEKAVDFEGDAYDVGPFEVTLTCTFQGEDIDVPGGAAREIAAGDTVTYDGLPIGAECVVTETDDGGAASSTVSAVGDGDPGAVTIAADPASITVTNTFDAVPPPPNGGDNGGGSLPITGADIIMWVGIAVLLLAAGVILVGIRRRNQH
ncbi:MULTISPECIES: DUF5979 domain-containing protein [unclassified Isoptericola]|uniref:DUF5979 domain-containing protein n=1 Tax=unclassified Isoptericola TaxID=2623355 RepID=UPI003656838F